MTGLVVVLLILSVVILVGNTMIAIAFLRGRLGGPKRADQDAIDELHRRVQDLTGKHK